MGKTCCPQCNEKKRLWIMDKGWMYWKRLLSGNNRFVCPICRITWRRKMPEHATKLRDVGTIEERM